MAPPGEPTCPRCGSGTGASRFCPSCGLALELLSPGQIVDEKYEVLDKIGEGGMGEIYRARHLHLDEIRIIKVTRPDAARGQTEIRRFQEEARMAALVRHPNVAALYDFSRRPDGTFYMVWEFIDGVTLQQYLRAGPLTLTAVLEIAQQVLAGLEAIHEQGIVHRDLSPDNIMIRETPAGRLQAKIIDLGIAKRLTSDSLQMTGTGMFLGKVKYGSPEQAGSLKAGETIDGRSDIYSFGVVLYEMLMGRAPFEAHTPQEYLGKHLHQPAPPLDLSVLPAAVGPAIAAVVAKALEKDRERRFRSAREFAEALRALAPASGMTPAALASTLPTVALPKPSPRSKAARVVVVLAVPVAAAAIWMLAHSRTRVEKSIAAAPTARPPTATASSTATPTAPPALPTSIPAVVPTVRATRPPATRREKPSATPSPTLTESPTATRLVIDARPPLAVVAVPRPLPITRVFASTA